MLDILRKGKRGVTMMILAGFVALLMIGFGVDINTKQPHLNAALRINGEEITQSEFYRREQIMAEMFRQQFKTNFDQIRPLLRLEQRTVDQIIREKLLSAFLAELGLTAGKPQIEEKIRKDPWFERNPLNEQTFQYYLQARGVTPAGLEDDVRKEIASAQLENFLADLNTPTETELRSAFVRENTKSEFAYVSFRPGDFEKSVEASDDTKIKEYFETNAERYKTPRAVHYSYVPFNPSSFLDKVTIEPQDLQEMYESRISEFEDPMQIKLRELVIRKPGKSASAVEEMLKGTTEQKPEQTSADSEEAKRKKVAELHDQLEAGADFAKLAEENSENKDTAVKGGDRGWVSVATFDAPVRRSLEKLEKNGFTEVLDSPDAWTIYFAEDLKEAQAKPFEQVRGILETELRTADAPEYARIMAEETLNRWEQNDDNRKLNLLDFAKQEGLTAETSGDFLATDQNPANPAAVGLTAKVINLPKGEREVVRVNQLEFLVEVVDHRQSAIPDFSVVREQVMKDFVAEKSRELARTAAETALQELRGDQAEKNTQKEKTLAQIAAQHGLAVKNTSAVSRSGQSTDEFFNVPGLRQSAFTLTMNEPYPREIASGPDGAFYVYRLLKETAPTDEEYSKVRSTLLEKEREKIKSRLGGFVLEALKASADVWVDPKILGEPQLPEPVDL